MATPSSPSVEQIFAEALARPPGPERSRFLDDSCGGSADVRKRVERLLRAHRDAESFLEFPAADPDRTIAQPHTEFAGAQIGPYKLLQQVGEGGMGIVYLADQHQ